MQLPNQIETISVARAANAVHYEYLATVLKRTEEIRLENELWQRAVDEFRRAFDKEDKEPCNAPPTRARSICSRAIRSAPVRGRFTAV